MPAVAAPPAPPTAAPSPTPSPAPAPAPSPAPSPQKSSADAFDDQFADLDAPPPAPAPKPAPAPAPKADAKPGAAPAPAAKKDDAAAPEPKADEPAGADEFSPPAVANINQVRMWAVRMGKRAKTAHDELSQLRTKVEQLESTSTQRNGQDHGAMAEQLAAANKKLEQYEQDLRITRYERSNEYKEKWEVPYKRATERAYRDVAELTVTVREPNPNDPDHPIERERQATKADFDAVFQQPLGRATKLAKELFGDSYALVLQHRERIRELQEGAYSAVEEYRSKGAEQEKQTEARTQQEQQFIASAWQKANESMKAKGAEFFDERPDDAEGNELLKKGMDHADLAFDPDAKARFPLPQQIAIDARVRNWAGSFLRNRRDILKLKAELAERDATIEQLRGSGPGKPAPAGDAAPSTVKKGLFEAFDEQVK